jgi:hypothetical protein
MIQSTFNGYDPRNSVPLSGDDHDPLSGQTQTMLEWFLELAWLQMKIIEPPSLNGLIQYDTIRNVVVHVLVLNMWAEFGTKTAAYIIHFTNTKVLGKPKSLQNKRQINSNLYPTVLFIQHQLHCFHSILDMPWEYLLWTKPDGWVVVDPRIQHIKKPITTTAHLSLSLFLLDVYIYMWFVITWTHEPSQHSDPYKATALIV